MAEEEEIKRVWVLGVQRTAERDKVKQGEASEWTQGKVDFRVRSAVRKELRKDRQTPEIIMWLHLRTKRKRVAKESTQNSHCGMPPRTTTDCKEG